MSFGEFKLASFNNSSGCIHKDVNLSKSALSNQRLTIKVRRLDISSAAWRK